MKKGDTELTMMASEFYVLSQLWLRNMPATLSLGRRKSIDIFVETRDGTIKTIDVKGIHMHGIGDKWPIGKKDWTGKKDHYFILARWGDLEQPPEIWVVPASDAEKLKVKWIGDAYALYFRNEKLKNYQNRWDLLGPGEKDG